MELELLTKELLTWGCAKTDQPPALLGLWDARALAFTGFGPPLPPQLACAVEVRGCTQTLLSTAGSVLCFNGKATASASTRGNTFPAPSLGKETFGKLRSSCCWSFSQAHLSTRARCVGAGLRPRASSHAPLLPEPPGTRRCRQTAPKSWVGGQTSELKSLCSLLPPSCYRQLWHSGQFSVWLCQGFP